MKKIIIMSLCCITLFLVSCSQQLSLVDQDLKGNLTVEAKKNPASSELNQKLAVIKTEKDVRDAVENFLQYFCAQVKTDNLSQSDIKEKLVNIFDIETLIKIETELRLNKEKTEESGFVTSEQLIDELNKLSL
ncbi:MAG: hypothetical protein WC860_08730, partial [Candidatus Margulisiibacteriota bacterium]